ncbi:MAG: lycopene cyclase domain-containing protein [Thermoplasmatota archaeon]
MYLYLIIDIAIIIFPLLLSFDKRVAFYKRWGPLAGSILTVGTLFVIWDIYATYQGHWAFNERYLTGIYLFGLPIEEIMFFVTVPYACIFTFEVISCHIRDWKVPFSPIPYLVAGGVLSVAALIFHDQGYTFLALISLGLFLIFAPVKMPELLGRRHFWLFITITILLFVFFNYLLTSIPIVTYGPDFMWGDGNAWNGRFLTIPLEDFFYNMSMLSWYLFVYLIFKGKMGKNENGSPETM